MASASQITDNVALLFLQNIREGMRNGRIANMDAVQTEVDAAIAKLDHRQLPDGRVSGDMEPVSQLHLEIVSLRNQFSKCESQLAEFETQAKAIKEDTAQIVSRAEACNVLAEQQLKENVQVLAALESVNAGMLARPPPSYSSHCTAPAPSPTNPILRPTPSRTAVISFPGGARTVTIHPPGSPSHQSVVRDESGDIIIDFRRRRPLRREGAFSGPLEDVDWREITRVSGRAPDLPRASTTSVPRRTGSAETPTGSRPSSHMPGEAVAEERELSSSTQTDLFGRIVPSRSLIDTESLSSVEFRKVSRPSSGKIPVAFTAPSLFLTPPSPTSGRGRKRARNDGDDEPGAQLTQRDLNDSLTTLGPIKHEESLHLPHEGRTKRQKLPSSASLEASRPGSSLTRTRSLLDLTQGV